MKKINIGISDFALPVPRKGSIESLSGFGDSTLGQEIHQRVQRQRARQNPNYESETFISHEFPTGKYIFNVSGRMDGFFSGSPPTIEEIKSTFSIRELIQRLANGVDSHPYCLQLKTYGYIHWLKTQEVPLLKFYVVSTRNFSHETFSIPLEVEAHEFWLKARLEELHEEVKLSEKRTKRRMQAADHLTFPFDNWRSGQPELVESIEEAFKENQRMLIQAPTGLGKTVGVLFPTLKEALSRGQRVIYVTPKNSQHAVAEDALDRFREKGTNIKSLTITAKQKICMKEEVFCNPSYCEYAKDHYTKMAENKVQEQLSKKKSLKSKTFKNMAEKYQVCPFEAQLDAAQDVDVVVCDYNYAFAPRSAFGRLSTNGIAQPGKPNLVIDEAHNLPSRSMDYFSPQVSTVELNRRVTDIDRLPKRFQSRGQSLLNECIQIVFDCAPEGGEKSKIEAPLQVFSDQETNLREFLSEYLESDAQISRNDFVMGLYYYWLEFTSALEYVALAENNEFFVSFQPVINGAVVKITCCDASSFLKDKYDQYEHVVGFSATLKPFEYYSQLSGLKAKSLKTAEFASPFLKSNRKLLVVPQVSSRFSARARNYPRIAEAIQKIAELKSGNYFAFFPSFDFLEQVARQFSPPEGFRILKQERFMKRQHVDDVMESLKDFRSPTIIFAVQGGVFAEGVDYPGDMLIGAFIVGAPLPNFDFEREEMRAYYEKNYGTGFDYAYAFPAMAKAVQAAGRVIRSETDRGLIVLMDDRFTEANFSKSMPADWFEVSPRELVSQSILEEISEFWSQRG